MNVKDIIETEIESNGMDGEGVAHVDGKVVFIPYTLKGERVRAVVKTVKSRYATASVIKVLSPSADRVEPDCPHYFKCGGCDMRHVSESYRRKVLESELLNNLKKIAGLDGISVGFVQSEGAKATRNKVAMPFGYSGGKVVLGLYRQNSHVLEPVDCRMLGKFGKIAVQKTVEFCNERGFVPYDFKSGKGLLRHLVVREIGERATATLVINGDGLGAKAESELARRLPDNIDFFICKNTAANNVILGESVRLVKGNERMPVEVLGIKAELSPLSFFQVNDGVRDKLYEAAIGAVESPTLIDLYSGIGITSNLAARKCERVIAVEIVPQAVADAKRTAELNGNAEEIENVCGEVEKVLPRVLSEIDGEKDVLVDPPRKGCDGAVMNAIAAATPRKLIYISCNHATMCRDIKYFLSAAAEKGDGYAIEKCELFDMFPFTHHIETLIVLSHEKPNKK